MTADIAAAPPDPAATTAITRLTRLGVIMVSGPEARSYLQGQVTADLQGLQANHIQLACCNSPQGRVQAVFWMLERAEGTALVLPASMLDATLARLRKYVLRAKAKIEISPSLRVGFMPRSAVSDVTLPAPNSHHERGGVSYFNLPGLDATTMAVGTFDAPARAESEHWWQLSHVRAGLPQVYPETHEAFVAQMLNIDLLGGISFEKGCYTGQEIIARAHFRGTVKRRMFLFHFDGPPPAPGTRILAGEQHAGDVVDAVAAEGGADVLAVISLAQVKSELRLDGREGVLGRLELPYRMGEE